MPNKPFELKRCSNYRKLNYTESAVYTPAFFERNQMGFLFTFFSISSALEWQSAMGLSIHAKQGVKHVQNYTNMFNNFLCTVCPGLDWE